VNLPPGGADPPHWRRKKLAGHEGRQTGSTTRVACQAMRKHQPAAVISTPPAPWKRPDAKHRHQRDQHGSRIWREGCRGRLIPTLRAALRHAINVGGRSWEESVPFKQGGPAGRSRAPAEKALSVAGGPQHPWRRHHLPGSSPNPRQIRRQPTASGVGVRAQAALRNLQELQSQNPGLVEQRQRASSDRQRPSSRQRAGVASAGRRLASRWAPDGYEIGGMPIGSR